MPIGVIRKHGQHGGTLGRGVKHENENSDVCWVINGRLRSGKKWMSREKLGYKGRREVLVLFTQEFGASENPRENTKLVVSNIMDTFHKKIPER